MAPDERRTQILDASRQVFGQRGYHGTSISHIVSAAGVARGTFYNYFPSKRAVFQAVLDDIMEQVEGAVHPMDPTRDIAAQVRENLERLILTLSAREDLPRLLFGEALGIDEEGDDALRGFYATALHRIEHALILGQQFGVVHSGDPVLWSRCLLGLLKEPAFQASLHNETLDAHALVEAIFAFLAQGVLTGPSPRGV